MTEKDISSIIVNSPKVSSDTNVEESQYKYTSNYSDEFNPDGLRQPTDEESKTLRRILGRAPYASYLICLAELAERASYYSVSGLLTNFIQRPLPEGSKTGAPLSRSSSESAGALGLGLQTAQALTLLLTFLAYVVPLFGGFVADSRWGKLKAIWFSVFAGFVSHVLFIIAGIPSVITQGYAIVPTILAILTLALGTGFIKPNLLPLLMDQYPEKTDVVKVLPSGEKVIVDRQKSLERMTLIFYWSINIGAFFRLATSYCERRVGFWLAFFVPIIVYLFLPVIFFFLERKLQKEAPQGSLLQNAWKILRVSLRGNWIKRVRRGVFWDYAKPSNMSARGEKYYNSKRQSPITWNEQWVLDVKQTVNSCKIFIYFPIFFITDGGLGSVQASQAGSMSTEGIPNDLFSNFNPLTIIVLIPILDYLIYPTLRRYKINLKPVDRITFGFILCASSQVAGAVIQHRIYSTSPCGNFATTCAETSPLSAWREVSLYILQAAGECFAATTAYELAYTRSPPQMKGLVMAIFLFTNSISAAISQALVGALVDPHLIWPFTAMAVIGFVTAGMFRFHFRNLHKDMEIERIERERLDQTQREGQEVEYAAFDQKENKSRTYDLGGGL